MKSFGLAGDSDLILLLAALAYGYYVTMKKKKNR